MFLKIWRLIFITSILALSACNGAPTPTKEAPCLVGAWQLVGEETFARAIVPPGAFDPEALLYRDMTGAVGYGFTADGKVLVQLSEVTGQFDVRGEQSLAALELLSDGLASGTYTLEGDLLKITPSEKNAITLVANLDGETMMDTLKAQDFVPLFVAPFTTAKMTCSGDSLSLEILNLPTVSEPLTFVRVIKEEEK
jgi:hypothetical protein